MSSFLDKTGLTKLWNLIKSYIDKNHPKYEILGNVDAPDIEIETPNLGGGSSGSLIGGNSSYIFPSEVSKAVSYILCGGLYGTSYDTPSFSGQIISPEEIEKIKNACENLTSTSFIIELTGPLFYRGLLKAMSPSKTEEELDIALEELKGSMEEDSSGMATEVKLMQNMKLYFNCSSFMNITGNIDESTEADESIYSFDFLTTFGSSSTSEGSQFIMSPICVMIGILSEYEVMYNVTLGSSNIGI